MAKHRESPTKRVNPSGKVVWVARYTDAYGRRRWVGTFKKRGPCGAGRTDCCAQDAIDAAYASPVVRDTVGEYAKDWTERYPRSERTDATNAGRVRAVVDVELETEAGQKRRLRDWPLAELRRRHGYQLFDHMLREQGRAVSGARAILTTLSAIAEDAITNEVIAANPFKGLRLHDGDRRAKKQPKESRIWTFEQMHEFAAAAGSHEPEIQMLSDCGLRVGEMFALQRKLQDLKVGIFRVKGTAWNGKLLETSREKNHDREGPIPPTLLSMLGAMLFRIDTPWLFSTPGAAHTRKPRIDWPSHEDLKTELEHLGYRALSRKLGVSDNALRNRIRAYEAGRQPGDGPHNGGGLLWRYENWMRDVWRPAQNATGVDPTPKEFRASYNTLLLAAGVDRADLADMLGHSENVNAERYTQALRRSGDKVRALIG